MRTHDNRLPVFVAAAWVMLTQPAIADQPEPTQRPAGALVVNVVGLKSSDGQVRFALFNSKETYLKSAFRGEVVPIMDKKCQWHAKGLPFGEYALAVHHDENGNGVMERHWYGKPKEPGGFSNDAPAKFGPAKYKKAMFKIDSDLKTIEVKVR